MNTGLGYRLRLILYPCACSLPDWSDQSDNEYDESTTLQAGTPNRGK